MSHVTKMKLEVNDLDSLAAACERIGCELVRNQTTWKWYGRWVNDYGAEDAAYKNGISVEDYGKCLHAIRVKGNPRAYEIGVVASPSGKGFALVFDFYGSAGRAIQDRVGKDGKNLERWYAAERGVKALRKQRLKATLTEVGGRIRVRATL